MQPEWRKEVSDDVSQVLLEQRRQVEILIEGFVEQQRRQVKEREKCLKEFAAKQHAGFEAALQNALQGRAGGPRANDSVLIPANPAEASPAPESEAAFEAKGDAVEVSAIADINFEEVKDEDNTKTPQYQHAFFESLQFQVKRSSVMFSAFSAVGQQKTYDRCLDFMSKSHLHGSMKFVAIYIVRQPVFSTAISLMILGNAVCIAMQANNFMQRSIDYWESANDSLARMPTWLIVLDVVFAVAFTIEVVLRLIAEEFTFFIGIEWRWNLLDFTTVVSAWAELLMTFIAVDTKTDISLLRIFRILRVLRSIRIVRVMRDFRELRLILLSLLGSLMPLLWALSCLAIIVFVFVVLFLQGAAGFIQDVRVQEGQLGEKDQVESLHLRFSSFPKTFLTLFKSITGGDDWSTVHSLLENASAVYGHLFIFYIAIMVFGVLNVITGIFVECAIAKARSDKELQMAEEEDRISSNMRDLMQLFRDLDADYSGSVSYEEWEKFTSTKEAKAALSRLELDVSKTKELFKLIDLDESNEVEVHEFVVGCMQLQGSAKMVDVETLLRNNKKLMQKCTDHFTRVEHHIEHVVASRLDKTDSVISRLEREVHSVLAPGSAIRIR